MLLNLKRFIFPFHYCPSNLWQEIQVIFTLWWKARIHWYDTNYNSGLVSAIHLWNYGKLTAFIQYYIQSALQFFPPIDTLTHQWQQATMQGAGQPLGAVQYLAQGHWAPVWRGGAEGSKEVLNMSSEYLCCASLNRNPRKELNFSHLNSVNRMDGRGLMEVMKLSSSHLHFPDYNHCTRGGSLVCTWVCGWMCVFKWDGEAESGCTAALQWWKAGVCVFLCM